MVVSYRSLSERVMKVHGRTSNNYKWLQENQEAIREDYSNQFIAIAGGKVVYNTDVYVDLLRYISEHRKQSDLIGIRVRPHDRVLLLRATPLEE